MTDEVSEKRAPRTWADFRPRQRQPAPELKILRAAARSQQGQVILAWMQSEVFRSLPNADDGALREQNGARRLVEKFEGLIASGRQHSSKQG